MPNLFVDSHIIMMLQKYRIFAHLASAIVGEEEFVSTSYTHVSSDSKYIVSA